MIYTIGNEKNYLEALNSGHEGGVLKTGRFPPSESFPDGYEGGYAFRSIADAQRLIDEKHPSDEYAIFGMLAEWPGDVEQAPDGWWYLLLRNAEIVRLER